MKVKTAVIFASGYGTRMLPITAAVQKELLPVLDRPVIDYVVSDCVRAGVERIIFTIRQDSHALKDYYLGDSSLEAELHRRGKTTALNALARVHGQAKFEFIEQPPGEPYGTAVPLQIASKLIEPDSAFIACGGDDFLWRTDGGSDMTDMVEAFERASADGAIMTMECPSDKLSRYGVLDIDLESTPATLKRIVEKPDASEAPSNLINISKYVLTTKLLDYVMKVSKDQKSGEYYITDAVQEAARDHKIIVSRAHGEYLDAGTIGSWLNANQRVGESLRS